MTNIYPKTDQINWHNEDLDIFVRVADGHNFSTVARELQITPKAVSKKIARLESALGVTLFERNTRHIRLTDEGRMIAERARMALSALYALKEIIQSDDHALTGRIRITAPAPFGRKYVAPAIADFCQHYPQVSFDLRLSDQVIDLYDGNFDLAIRLGELSDSQLFSRKISENRRILVASPAFVDQYGQPTHPSELPQFNCLVFAYPGVLHNQWILQEQGEEHSVQVHGRLSSDNGDVLHAWCCAGLGISLRETWDVHEALRLGTLVRILPRWQSKVSPISLVRARKEPIPRRLTVFSDFLAQRWADASWDRDAY